MMKRITCLLATVLLGASFLASAQANAESYLVMAHGNKVPPGLAKEIAAAGGTRALAQVQG